MRDAEGAPIGIRLVRASPCRVAKRTFVYRLYVMVFTFFVYTFFHMTRKAISVVKTEWNPNCTNKSTHANDDLNIRIFDGKRNVTGTTNCSGWHPFDGPDGNFDLGVLDGCFLFAYALTMFISGHFGDRVNLTYLLTIGMLGTGIFTAALGIPYFMNLHSFPYFIVVQLIGGAFQSIGWPTVVAIMTKWYGKGNRGLFFGIWNSHTSVGNILGAVIPGVFVDSRWGYSFVVPGLMMVTLGILVFLFLPSDPAQVSVAPPQHHLPRKRQPQRTQAEEKDERHPLYRDAYGSSPLTTQSSDEDDADNNKSHGAILAQMHKPEPIGFLKAVQIPGVIEFSFSLFFAKLVAYTFLYWLPKYVDQSFHNKLSDEEAADLSTFFDVGGIGGGILIGFMADRIGMNAVPCLIMQLLCIPVLIFYNKYGGINYSAAIGLSCLSGFMVNGPYCLITTAVSADLATHKDLKDNQEAKATVAAIIDGTGSIGAALGPLMTGWISGRWGWSKVFLLLVICCGLAAVFLLRLVVKEMKMLWQRWKYTYPSYADL
ncbi:glucose-6-phosphate exchanger SLC37A2-like isoform X2 [Corticium candelabrum]|uniref:glucose-6-phosphate exchanger SLC37A2-like isoform X2 n=1 Tax=Corticium candelabrum TaxID=121492 RepID=UPI002E26BAAB|nr:glucose-6-phosphate exchanger SLC37A2-like isoform X2 [Corticium candelabrum]